MFDRLCSLLTRPVSLPTRRAATVAGLVLALVSPAHARESADDRGPRRREPLVFTVDVAEDLAGKFVPTKVRPEDTQPERGSFFVTEGRVFPAGTIPNDSTDFDPYQRGHVGVWSRRGTHLVAGNAIPAALLWSTPPSCTCSAGRVRSSCRRKARFATT